MGWGFEPAALRRVRATESQVGLTMWERQENVASAFAADAGIVRDRCVLVIDDVLTTGATLGACAEALRTAGAAQVFGAAVASAVYSGDSLHRGDPFLRAKRQAMELKIHTRNVDVNPRLQEHVEKKVSKLDRYLPNIQEVRVDLAIERRKQGSDQAIAQLTLRNTRGVILRAEDKRQPDIYAALDVALDKMYRQIERYKGKRKRRGGGRYAEADADLAAVESAPSKRPRKRRTQDRDCPPQTDYPGADERRRAIDQMELLGHSFIFYNAESAKLGVLYRREDGNYGVLNPTSAERGWDLRAGERSLLRFCGREGGPDAG